MGPLTLTPVQPRKERSSKLWKTSKRFNKEPLSNKNASRGNRKKKRIGSVVRSVKNSRL